jgi:hypothetical protein
MGTAEEISQSSQALLEKVASGKITPSQARDIHAMLEAQRKIIETESFDNRLRAIEQRVQGEPGKDRVTGAGGPAGLIQGLRARNMAGQVSLKT